MTALAKNVQRRKLHLIKSIRIALPVKANTVIYDGALVAVDANGLAVPAADAAALKVMGVAVQGFDNTGGANGVIGSTNERYVVVETGAWSFEATGGAAGVTAMVADDNSVDIAANTTNDIPVGPYLEPDPESSSMWYVLIKL